MSEAFLGEIRMFAGNFAPEGWSFCNGQLIPIIQNDALYALIGTTYGGDGQNTFGLPDLQGRIPIHMGQGPGITQNYLLGQKLGVESVTLVTANLPAHTHALSVSTANATATTAQNNFPANSDDLKFYAENTPSKNFSPSAVTSVGGGQPHDNIMPSLVVSFIIALAGIYPTAS